MSRLGKKPVDVPAGVEIKIAGDVVVVKGPKGELSQKIKSGVTISVDTAEKKILVTRNSGSKQVRALQGLYRSLLNNMIIGVTEMYTKGLEIVGVGYRAALQGNRISLSVGFINPVDIAVPDGIEVTLPNATEIVIKGIDKQKVGQFAATIRKIRPPEPYKGKGIRYKGEYVRKLEGKTLAAAGK